jgi:hypothetical protein
MTRNLELKIDRRGKVTMRGPFIEAEKDWWLTTDILKKQYRKVIARNERVLRRYPDHPKRAALLQDIEDAKRDFERVDEHYRDDVIERVVRSRTSASGEVEFIDPLSMLKLFKGG